jgi:hypothetical protein
MAQGGGRRDEIPHANEQKESPDEKRLQERAMFHAKKRLLAGSSVGTWKMKRSDRSEPVMWNIFTHEEEKIKTQFCSLDMGGFRKEVDGMVCSSYE